MRSRHFVTGRRRRFSFCSVSKRLISEGLTSRALSKRSCRHGRANHRELRFSSVDAPIVFRVSSMPLGTVRRLAMPDAVRSERQPRGGSESGPRDSRPPHFVDNAVVLQVGCR